MSGISFAHSQKVVHKTIDATGKDVEMKFDFADTILIEAWNKNSIELKATVDIDNNQYNDYYSLETSTDGNQAKLIEHVDFDGIKKLKGKDNKCNFNTDINYKLKVPANLEFSLKTISGKIQLIGQTGKMSVNSISGYIDYSIPTHHKALIDMSTVTGNVYSNLNFDGEQQPDKISWVGTKRHLSLNGGSLPVELKTVSGDIYLRKLE
jgi:hypothetical protein